MFNGKKIEKIYRFCEKGLIRRGKTALAAKLFNRYLYKRYLNEAHADAFADLCMLLRAENDIDCKLQKIYNYTNPILKTFIDFMDPSDVYPSAKYYSSLPVCKAVLQKFDYWRRKRQLKRFYAPDGSLNLALISRETAKIVFKHAYTPYNFKKLPRRDQLEAVVNFYPAAILFPGKIFRLAKNFFRHYLINLKVCLHHSRPKPLSGEDKESRIISACCRIDNAKTGVLAACASDGWQNGFVLPYLTLIANMRGNGGTVRINKMEAMLGIPVVPISAAKNEGVDELVDHALHVAKYQERPGRMDFCGEEDHGGAVHRCIHGIIHLIEDHAKAAGIPVRFAATKLVEGDQRIEAALKLDQNEKEMIEHIIVQMEQERGLDRAAAIADMRFHFIHQLVEQTVVKPRQSKEQLRSARIDRFLTGRYTAIPAFVGIMALVFYLTFGVIGLALQNLLEVGIDALTAAVDSTLTAWNVNAAVHSLVIDGIFTGVGSVLSFLPIIVTLFFFLSLLEDTGYMARVAFVMDKLLRRIGLSGRSIVPMLIGFGCTVPGVMASRTLPSERDRKMTILLTPFMSCSAKLPIYSLFAAAFFPEHAALVMVSLYFLGIAVGILMAILLKSSVFKGEAVPFVMELPNYRLPGLKNVVQLLWEKARDFLQRAFTVIFVATIIIWFLQSFDLRLSLTADPQQSILAWLASGIAPLFAPLGFADWRVSTALITGFMAKESVVSTLTILYGSSAAFAAALSPAAAAPLLVFCLLYTPCIAAVASVKRELGGKWAFIMVANQCIVAWLAAFGTRLIMML